MKVLNDITPPHVDNVTIVTSSRLGYHDALQLCQTSENFFEVVIDEIVDIESGIERYLFYNVETRNLKA